MTHPTTIDTAIERELRLLGARALVRLDNFSADVQYQLHFRNGGDRNVEGIFTFSLGAKAQFQKLRVRRAGGEWQHSKIVSRREADEEYERQTERGNTALTVQRNSGDLVTINIGTLKPGEAVDIQLGLAVLMDIDAGVACVRVPTSIVPRYGDPAADGLEPPEAPKTDLREQQPFDVRVLLDSGFRGSSIVDCTYDLRDAPHPDDGSGEDWLDEPFDAGGRFGRVEVLLGDGRAMVSAEEMQFNRTFELRLKNFAAKCWVSVVDDAFSGGAIAYLNYYMDGAAPKQQPRVHVLVDCSGSMHGGGEEVAQQCLRDLVRELPEDAAVGLSCFGSGYREVFPLGDGNLDKLSRRIPGLDAEMGGTNLRRALQQLLQELEGEIADILLLTDGAVHESAEFVDELRRQNRRVFCIGIGSAPHEGLVQDITDATGGKYGFIAEHRGSSSADTIKEFAHALACQQLQIEKIQWPWQTQWQSKTPLIVHDRTVARGYAFVDAPAAKMADKVVRLKLKSADDSKPRVVEAPIIASRADAAPAIVTSAAAARRLTMEDYEARQQFALNYQLLSDETSCILVLPRKDGTLAESEGIVQVAQMMPAGSHGFGDRHLRFCLGLSSGKTRRVDVLAQACKSPDVFESRTSEAFRSTAGDYWDACSIGFGESDTSINSESVARRRSVVRSRRRNPMNFLAAWVHSADKSELLKTCSPKLEHFIRKCTADGIPEYEVLKLIFNIVVRKLGAGEIFSEKPVNKGAFPDHIWDALNNGFEKMTLKRWRFTGKPRLTHPSESDLITNKHEKHSTPEEQMAALTDPWARDILDHLVAKLKCVTPGEVDRYPTYSGLHFGGLNVIKGGKETYGESLSRQGLLDLSLWLCRISLPAITGIIVNAPGSEGAGMPSAGFFQAFGREPDDLVWWEAEIVKAKAFNWQPYIDCINASKAAANER